MIKKFFLFAAACIFALSIQSSAFALTGLMSQQTVSTKISVKDVKREEVVCTKDKPELQDSTSMFDCINTTMDFNFSFSSFDFSGMLDKLKSSACNYANSQVSNYKNQAQGMVTSQINNATGGVVNNVTSAVNNTLGTQAGSAVTNAIQSSATVGGSISGQGVTGTATQGTHAVGGSYNPFAK